MTKLPKPEARLVKVIYSTSGDELLLGLATGKIHVYNAKNRNYDQTTTLVGHTSNLVDMAFSPVGGEFLGTASVDLTMRIWDVSKGYAPHSVFYAPVNEIGFSKKNVVIIGESTGNKKSIEFEL